MRAFQESSGSPMPIGVRSVIVGVTIASFVLPGMKYYILTGIGRSGPISLAPWVGLFGLRAGLSGHVLALGVLGGCGTCLWPQIQLANLGWPAGSGTWQVAQPPVLDPWMGLAPTHEESTRCWQGACMCLDAVGQLWLAGCFWAQQVFATADSAFPLEGPLCPPWGVCWGFPSPPPPWLGCSCRCSCYC